MFSKRGWDGGGVGETAGQSLLTGKPEVSLLIVVSLVETMIAENMAVSPLISRSRNGDQHSFTQTVIRFKIKSKISI